MLPAVPVIFGAAIFYGDDRIAGDEILKGNGTRPAASSVLPSPARWIFSVAKEFRGGAIEREHDVLAGPVAAAFAGLGDEAEGFVG